VKQHLAKLNNVPVDIEPIFTTADEIAPEGGKPPAPKPKPAPRRKARRR
jgi:hypothetical protein